MNRLLIIPARAGSKRVKKKNIKIFYGKPIIYYSIQSALKSKLFSKIHVSTDSMTICNLVRKYSIKTDFLRPKKLADDNTKLLDVYNYVVQKYAKNNLKFDEIWFLSACSPTVQMDDLIKSARFFMKNKNNSFLSINECSPPIQWSMKLTANNRLIPISPKLRNTRSQDLKKNYIDNGAFGAYKSEVFYNKKKINYAGYITTKKIIDIDNQFDWDLTKLLFKIKKT